MQISMATLYLIPPWILIVVCCCCRRFLTELCWKQFIHISECVDSGECRVWLSLARHSSQPSVRTSTFAWFSEKKTFKNRNCEQLEGESSIFSKASAECLAAFKKYIYLYLVCNMSLQCASSIWQTGSLLKQMIQLFHWNFWTKLPQTFPKASGLEWGIISRGNHQTRGSQELWLAANSFELIPVSPIELIINGKSTNVTWNRS